MNRLFLVNLVVFFLTVTSLISQNECGTPSMAEAIKNNPQLKEALISQEKSYVKYIEETKQQNKSVMTEVDIPVVFWDFMEGCSEVAQKH